MCNGSLTKTCSRLHTGFVRDRDPYVIRLVRNTDTTPAEGIYHCAILDNTETEQRVYVGGD